MKIKILNRVWKCRVYSLKTYQKHCGSDSVALCDLSAKSLTFLKPTLNLEAVIHELVHAYTAELAFVELDLDDDQVEEFHCELFARHGERIIAQAKSIVSHFLKKK